MRKPLETKIFFCLLIVLLFGTISCRPSGRDEFKAKTNSPPLIKSVSIFPEKPTRENDLNINIEASDPDKDPITYHYQWIKNGTEMIGENGNILKKEKFQKGDMIGIRVTPSDGREGGKPFLSSLVNILSSPPSIQEVRIEPRIASANEDLRAIIRAADPDGDAIYFDHKWEINGIALPMETKEILERTRFKKGDSIAVTVTPNDREVMGLPKKSEVIIISNSPPIIISSPPTSMERMTYRYQVKADDPDHDPVVFELKSGPKGMEINKKTGLILWEVQKEDKGSHNIEIEVSDNEGAKSIQRYILRVDFGQ